MTAAIGRTADIKQRMSAFPSFSSAVRVKAVVFVRFPSRLVLTDAVEKVEIRLRENFLQNAQNPEITDQVACSAHPARSTVHDRKFRYSPGQI